MQKYWLSPGLGTLITVDRSDMPEKLLKVAGT